MSGRCLKMRMAIFQFYDQWLFIIDYTHKHTHTHVIMCQIPTKLSSCQVVLRIIKFMNIIILPSYKLLVVFDMTLCLSLSCKLIIIAITIQLELSELLLFFFFFCLFFPSLLCWHCCMAHRCFILFKKNKKKQM